ncbi:hypothetical protein NEPAR06_1258 [Nematocida parisii]|nr:hypothetical protein NEPAR08_2368 [Nematocida parisii]KAI5131238.1 hypothetical protein NEPAR03_2350 [Nematocida parisii]KAI5140775.1 hypothetical protein NEPAR04_0492 [Nematocida parisii]KAI5144975.1 hypothetical protein NEPAR07_1386 [Nematocida parisii]KAI5154627.1 hypothetical protein NEPAR06_1258 [Nematocida parisii]
MKRKTGAENYNKELKRSIEEVEESVLEEAPPAPAQPTESVLEEAVESPRPSLGDGTRVLIEAARNTISRLFAIMFPEAREARSTMIGAEALSSVDSTPSSPDVHVEGSAQPENRETGEEEPASETASPQYIPLDVFRAILLAVQSIRENPLPQDFINSAEFDTFFNNVPNESSTEQNSPHARSIIFTITYYLEENSPQRKTVGKEDLEAEIPEVKAEGGEGECPICLQNIEKEETIRKLICHHTFHSECVSEWLTSYSNECPMCRKEAVPLPVEESTK